MKNGRKWRIIVREACPSGELPIIDTQLLSKKKLASGNNGWERPVRAYELLIDALEEDDFFDKDVLYFYPAAKGFSLKALGESLRKMGKFLNKPIVEEKHEETNTNTNDNTSSNNTSTSV